ncbi:MAG: fused MFS/spermidine synthase, partial [Anaerolineae bacterium]|nr:fused MFS/spermidine synthase [Anaerolineae bacterium]
IGLHSVYHPQSALSEGIWDYFLVAPLFAAADEEPVANVQSLYLVGLAGGTVAQLYTRAYGPIPIDGAELDPAIVEVARTHFRLDALPNVHAAAADGRRYLLAQPADRRYSVIAVDAYRPPYIPFHLATVEFFRLARDHLTENGVVAVNAARSRDDYRLVNALAATMAQVFPSVYAVDPPDDGSSLGNTLLVATVQPTSLADFRANAAALDPAAQPLLAEVARRALATARPIAVEGPVLTDDRAPIEQIVHAIVLRYFLE